MVTRGAKINPDRVKDGIKRNGRGVGKVWGLYMNALIESNQMLQSGAIRSTSPLGGDRVKI